MALNYENPSPVDTHNELPSFVPEQEFRATHAAAQQLARHRDQLVTENAQLRREVETLQRAQRELDEATRNGGDGGGRRLALLREALARKDNEILALKTHHMGRDRAAQEARDVVERMKRERAELEERLRSRDGVFQAIEAERTTLGRALETVRQEREQAASALMQADGTVHEWRRYAEERTCERDEARRQLGELGSDAAGLRAALHVANADRQRLMDAHAQELAAVRAELAAAVERARAESEAAQDGLTSRFEAARAAHAMALRAMEDDQAAELAAERAGRIAAEQATVALKRSMENERELTAESLRAEHLDAVAAIHQEYSVALRSAEEAARESLRAAMAAAAEALQAAEEALQAAEEAAAAGRRALEDEVSAERARATDLERELEATREALGTYATDTIERIEAAERTAREAQGYRDRYARKLAAAMEQVRVLRTDAESEARAQGEALQGLGGMVGQMTARMVLQAARDLAARAGREAPGGEDVDAAIAAMTDAVPAEVADELWAQREAFMDASDVE
jgi:DNA repair exonuclease SbcCD ATPase subunit